MVVLFFQFAEFIEKENYSLHTQGKTIPPMQLAASKVDFRTGCKVGVQVVLVVTGIVTIEEEGMIVVLAVELVGNRVAVGSKQNCVLFTTWQSLTLHSVQTQVVLATALLALTQQTQLLRLSRVLVLEWWPAQGWSTARGHPVAGP